MKTLEISRVPHWIARAEAVRAEARERRRRFYAFAALWMLAGLLAGGLGAMLTEFFGSR